MAGRLSMEARQMADETKKPAPAGQDTRAAEGPKGRPNVAASKELNGLAQAQRPKGVLGRIRGEGEPKRAGPLPVPHRKNVSAFTPPPVIERWHADASGVRAVEIGDNVITMFGMVGEDFWTGEGITAKRTVAALRAIGARPVEVHINSFGGDMFEGIAIYNALREHPQEVTVKVLGMAASAASIITMAGDKREIGAGSFIMIHNCSVMGGGNRHDFAEMAAFLEPFDRAMADVYAEVTGLEAKAIQKMMDDETYLSGSVAIAKGFATGLMTADKTKVDEQAKAADHKVNELRAVELQLVASGMPRSEARDRINKIKSTPGAALEGDTPGAVPDTGDAGSVEPKADDLSWLSAAAGLASTLRT
jgi:ATP-dependent protease ClpP protease subunit